MRCSAMSGRALTYIHISVQNKGRPRWHPLMCGLTSPSIAGSYLSHQHHQLGHQLGHQLQLGHLSHQHHQLGLLYSHQINPPEFVPLSVWCVNSSFAHS